MEKSETATVSKNIPFIQFVDNHSVYAHIVELKYKNPDKFADILTILGSFYTEMGFMSTIYEQLKESNIEICL